MPSLLVTLTLVKITSDFKVPLLADCFASLGSMRRFKCSEKLKICDLFRGNTRSLNSFIFNCILILNMNENLVFILVLIDILSTTFLVDAAFTTRESGGRIGRRKGGAGARY